MQAPIRSLTGLRFFAAAAVFVHHFIAIFYLELRAFPLGAPAVAFFFVLSGFILTYAYNDRLTRGSLRDFYVSRFARLWPLHLVCLILMLTVVYRDAWQSFSVQQWLALAAHLTLLQTLVPSGDFIFQFNGLAWSISVECFFYALFPWLLWNRCRPRWLLPAFILVATWLAAWGLSQWSAAGILPGWFDAKTVVHCHPLFRVGEFAVGVWLGQRFLQRQRNPEVSLRSFWRDTCLEAATLIGFVAFLWLGYSHWRLYHQFHDGPWGGEFVATWLRFVLPLPASVVLIGVFAHSRGGFSRLLSHPTLQTLGESSFALYLVHMVVLRRMRIEMGPFAEPTFVWHFLIAFGLSIACSLLLHQLIELPARAVLVRLARRRSQGVTDGRWRWPPLKSPASFAVGSVLLAVCLIGALQLTSYRPRFAPEVRRVIASSEPRLRNAKFVDEATLCGVDALASGNEVTLRFVWRLEPNSRRARVVQVLDAEGRILARDRLENASLRALASETYFLDTLQLSRESLAEAESIVVSFHADAGPMARVVVRDRSLRLGNRLRVLPNESPQTRDPSPQPMLARLRRPATPRGQDSIGASVVKSPTRHGPK